MVNANVVVMYIIGKVMAQGVVHWLGHFACDHVGHWFESHTKERCQCLPP